RIVGVLVLMGMAAALGTGSTAAQMASGRPDLSQVRSWGYQLQGADPETIAASAYDMVVIDYSRNGTQARAYSEAEIARMKRKPEGGRRIVLAYMSIGEAESYRFYWKDGWGPGTPDWLGRENRQWPDNYAVRYWD